MERWSKDLVDKRFSLRSFCQQNEEEHYKDVEHYKNYNVQLIFIPKRFYFLS